MVAPRRVQHSLDLLVVFRSKSCSDVSRWQRNMQGSLYVLTSPLETKAMCKSRKEGKQKGYLISFFRPLKFPVFASSLAEWEVQCWLPYKNRVLFCKLQFFKYYPQKSIKCLEVTESKAGRGRDRGGLIFSILLRKSEDGGCVALPPTADRWRNILYFVHH